MLSVQSSDVVQSLSARVEPVSGCCPEHGQYTTVRLRGTDAATCPRCYADRLRVETADSAFKVRVAHLHSVSHVPSRYATTGFSGFVASSQAHKSAVTVVSGFMRSVRDEHVSPVWRALLLTGGVGTGKTHLACALANNLVSRGVSVRYTTAHEMLSDIKRAYSTDGMTESSQIARYVNDHNLLILDEADVQRGTDNDASIIFAVVNGRYNAGRPMVMVSNQPVSEMPQFLGERVASRLMENATFVACDWGDYRRVA